MVRTSGLEIATRDSSLLDFVAGQLVRLELDRGDLRIVLPIIYPSGRWASVKVVGGPSIFVVTDDGDGSAEAETMGAERHYARVARKLAEDRGLKFNNHEIFEADATRDQIVGLAVLVAEAARDAVVRTCDWLADQVARDFAISLEDRLVDIFGSSAVNIGVDYAGSSAHRWSFDALVKTEGRPLLVSYVGTSPIAVAAAYTKFDDIQRGEDPPIGVIGVTKTESFEPHQLVLLRRAAKLRQINDSPDAWRRLAA